jgi:methylase of polypeptide subunit release factors
VYPIQLGATKDFAIARELLVRSQFMERDVARRLGVPLLTQPMIDEAPQRPASSADVLDLLIRVFVRNSFARDSEIEEHLQRSEMDALQRLGLLARSSEAPGLWYSPVCLCPVGDVYTVSDRWKTPDGKALEGIDDIVYPSVVPNTRLFLDLLPQSRCGKLLDLCSGTGVAALIGASKYAQEAYAYDIAPRSTHFAGFAKHLNGLANFTAGTGDLYEPAGDLMFDRIVAHPPYVPVLESKWIFYAGGEDGEHVTRRMMENVPRYLSPGGTLYCLAMASDRTGQPLETRIREWLGPQEKEFDIAVVVRSIIEPEGFAFGSLVRGNNEQGQARKWKELFETRRITALPYAMMMVQRKAAGREPFTVRRQTGPKTSRREHEWLLEWETNAASGAETLLAMPLKTSSECELRVLNRMGAEDWDAIAYSLATAFPFNMEMKTDRWIAYLLTRCDGTKTGGELFEELKRDHAIHVDTAPSDFADELKTLVSGGFLQTPVVEGCRNS